MNRLNKLSNQLWRTRKAIMGLLFLKQRWVERIIEMLEQKKKFHE